MAEPNKCFETPPEVTAKGPFVLGCNSLILLKFSLIVAQNLIILAVLYVASHSRFL
jgi:hypothetical protein